MTHLTFAKYPSILLRMFTLYTIMIISVTLTVPVFALDENAAPLVKEFNLIHYLPDSPVTAPFAIFDNLDAIAKILKKTLGVDAKISPHIFKKREDFEDSIAGKLPDFIIIDPLYIALTPLPFEVEPLTIMEIKGKITHSNILIVGKEFPYRDVCSLQNKSIAVTLPSSKEIKILKYLYFKGMIDPLSFFKTIKRVDNSSSALLSLLYRDCDASFVPDYSSELKTNSAADKIRRIYSTNQMLNGILACRKGILSASSMHSIQQNLLNLNETLEGKKTLDQMQISAWRAISVETLKKFRVGLTSYQDQILQALQPVYLTPIIPENWSSDTLPQSLVPSHPSPSLPEPVLLNVLD